MKSPDDVWIKPDNCLIETEHLSKITSMLAPYADQGHSERLTDLLRRLLLELDRRRKADGQMDLSDYDGWD